MMSRDRRRAMDRRNIFDEKVIEKNRGRSTSVGMVELVKKEG